MVSVCFTHDLLFLLVLYFGGGGGRGVGEVEETEQVNVESLSDGQTEAPDSR